MLVKFEKLMTPCFVFSRKIAPPLTDAEQLINLVPVMISLESNLYLLASAFWVLSGFCKKYIAPPRSALRLVKLEFLMTTWSAKSMKRPPPFDKTLFDIGIAPILNAVLVIVMDVADTNTEF
jgi:hypothetical protein